MGLFDALGWGVIPTIGREWTSMACRLATEQLGREKYFAGVDQAAHDLLRSPRNTGVAVLFIHGTTTATFILADVDLVAARERAWKSTAHFPR